MGNPIQEEWIRQHMRQLDAKLFISVGALFDFLSGRMRRYTVDIAQFLWLCMSYPLVRSAKVGRSAL